MKLTCSYLGCSPAPNVDSNRGQTVNELRVPSLRRTPTESGFDYTANEGDNPSAG